MASVLNMVESSYIWSLKTVRGAVCPTLTAKLIPAGINFNNRAVIIITACVDGTRSGPHIVGRAGSQVAELENVLPGDKLVIRNALGVFQQTLIKKVNIQGIGRSDHRCQPGDFLRSIPNPFCYPQTHLCILIQQPDVHKIFNVLGTAQHVYIVIRLRRTMTYRLVKPIVGTERSATVLFDLLLSKRQTQIGVSSSDFLGIHHRFIG